MDEQNMPLKEQRDDYDELTGLLNLKGVLRHLNEKKDSPENDYSVIIYLNVMNFKAFNQQYGFAGGNEFLKGLSAEINRIFRDEMVARTGGDHFIILSKSRDEDSITQKLQTITELSRKYERGLKMRVKAGIYLASGDESDPVVMIDRAKIACDDIIKVYDKDYNFYDDELKKKNELRQYVIDNFEIMMSPSLSLRE